MHDKRAPPWGSGEPVARGDGEVPGRSDRNEEGRAPAPEPPSKGPTSLRPRLKRGWQPVGKWAVLNCPEEERISWLPGAQGPGPARSPGASRPGARAFGPFEKTSGWRAPTAPAGHRVPPKLRLGARHLGTSAQRPAPRWGISPIAIPPVSFPPASPAMEASRKRRKFGRWRPASDLLESPEPTRRPRGWDGPASF
jgi:hypothetical protein